MILILILQDIIQNSLKYCLYINAFYRWLQFTLFIDINASCVHRGPPYSLGDKCRLTDPTDPSTGTYHLKDLKDHGDVDNRCLFWHCYREIGLNASQNQ